MFRSSLSGAGGPWVFFCSLCYEAIHATYSYFATRHRWGVRLTELVQVVCPYLFAHPYL